LNHVNRCSIFSWFDGYHHQNATNNVVNVYAYSLAYYINDLCCRYIGKTCSMYSIWWLPLVLRRSKQLIYTF